jgi:hypothetical protein
MNTVKTLPLSDALKVLSLPGLHRNLFSSPEWLRVLQRTYGTKIFVKYIERNGKIDGYIIYSVVKNFLEWKICFCSYCDYFDCYVKNTDDWQLFLQSLKEEYPQFRIAVRNLRDEVIRDNGLLEVLSKERFHFLDVREPLDIVWKKTHDSFRSAVKQSERAGVKVRRCNKEVLKDFFQMHLDLRKNKHRLFPQPYRFFDFIWEEFIKGGNGVLLGAYDANGKIIGANVYLICGNTLYYKFNTSCLSAAKLRPNNLLFWEGIKFAKEKGLEFIDLGSSGYDQEGLIKFKNHTGAQMMDITHLGYAPANYKFSQKRILRIMTQFFTLPWMPDFMVRLGSNIIYPFLA